MDSLTQLVVPILLAIISGMVLFIANTVAAQRQEAKEWNLFLVKELQSMVRKHDCDDYRESMGREFEEMVFSGRAYHIGDRN